MKACDGFCRRPMMGLMAVGILAFGVNAFGQEFSWVPVDSDTAFTTSVPDGAGADTAATMTASSSATIIEFELRVNGWINAPGSPTLGTAQASVDATGLLGVNASPSNAGVDLTPLFNQPWREAAGGFGLNDGAFMMTSTCHDFVLADTGIPCASEPSVTFAACPAGSPLCLGRDDWVFNGNVASKGVSTATPNFVWGGVTNAGVCTADNGSSFYLGTLVLNVPGGAAGTYTFGFDPAIAQTFINDCSGSALPGLTRTPGQLILQAGACCSISGGAGVCTEGVLEENCPIPPNTQWSAGLSCADVAAAGGCPSCLIDADCEDGNACTNDTCNTATNICSNVENFNSATECCDTASGAVTTIDDGDVCTADSCIAGAADHDPAGAAGVSCDDGVTRTCPDECDGVNSDANGGCIGTEISTFTCTSDADCCIGFCDVTGFCELIEDPSMCLEISDAAQGSNCFEEGEAITARVALGGSSQTITGGQFLINYDPTCVDVLDVHTCAGSPFGNVVADVVDPAAGTIWFAVTVDPMAGIGSNQDEDIVCIDMTRKLGCSACELCFDSINPFNTRLVNADGNGVNLNTSVCGPCSKGIGLDGTIDLTTPDGAAVNSDCDLPTAVVTWNMATATDSCDGALQVTCNAEHDGGVPIGHLIAGGGEFPQGVSFFECHAANSCGATAKNVWTVDVSDQQSLDIYVQLEAPVDPQMFSRCICFELFDDCVSGPTTECDTMWFGGPFNFDGKARVKLKVNKGQYHCVTAKDPLHTLRSVADIFCTDGQYSAEFRGDPMLGGNWLIAGNLDMCKGAAGSPDTVDIFDFGMFMNAVATGNVNPDPNTDCSDGCPNADVNSDGVVDNTDYAFILNNYLKASKNSCCPDAAAIAPPVTSITVKELRARGLGALAVGDLNQDGVLNGDDMASYMSGVNPVAAQRIRKETKVDGVRGR